MNNTNRETLLSVLKAKDNGTGIFKRRTSLLPTRKQMLNTHTGYSTILP